MSRAYIQPVMQFEDAEYGSLTVLLSDGTTLAPIYDPTSGTPIANPVGIDANGYVTPFHVDTGSLYTLVVRSFGGDTLYTLSDVAVLGGTVGATGPQGPQGIQGPANADGANVTDHGVSGGR